MINQITTKFQNLILDMYKANGLKKCIACLNASHYVTYEVLVYFMIGKICICVYRIKNF